MHRLPHLFGDVQERGPPARDGIRLVQQRRVQARRRLSARLGEPGALERRLGQEWKWQQDLPAQGGKLSLLAKIFANPNLPELDDYYEPFTFDYEHSHDAPKSARAVARPRSLITGERMEKIKGGPNWEEILGGEFEKRSKDYNFEAVQKEIYGEFRTPS